MRTAFPVLGEHARRRAVDPLAAPRTWPTPANRRALRAQQDVYGVCDALIAARRAHPTGEDGAPPIVSFLVRATGTYEGEAYSRSATGTFRMHSPGARLDTDHAAAQRRGSDIVVEVRFTALA